VHAPSSHQSFFGSNAKLTLQIPAANMLGAQIVSLEARNAYFNRAFPFTRVLPSSRGEISNGSRAVGGFIHLTPDNQYYLGIAPDLRHGIF